MPALLHVFGAQASPVRIARTLWFPGPFTGLCTLWGCIGQGLWPWLPETDNPFFSDRFSGLDLHEGEGLSPLGGG